MSGNTYYSSDELAALGLGEYGTNVRLSRKASVYGCERIVLGSNTRIDDFCVLSAGEGGIEIGNYVHIAAYASLIGQRQIKIGNFAGLSSRVSVYSSSDDYSGKWMTNPTVPSDLTNVHHADVLIGAHVIVGSGSVILPGVRLEDGAAIGALSLVNANCLSFGIYVGVPAKRVGERSKRLLELESILAARERG